MRDYAGIGAAYEQDRGSYEGKALETINEYQDQYYKDSMTIEEAERLAKVREEWDRIGEAAKILCDAVNHGKAKNVAKALFIGFGNSHRTLQNQGVAVMVEFLRIYKDTAYDLRNHAAVTAAAEIAQFADDQAIVFPVI